jgi:hypothetical protein
MVSRFRTGIGPRSVNSFPGHAGIDGARLRSPRSRFTCDSPLWSAKKIVLDNNARLYLMSVPKIKLGSSFFHRIQGLSRGSVPAHDRIWNVKSRRRQWFFNGGGRGRMIRVRLRVKSIVDREV